MSSQEKKEQLHEFTPKQLRELQLKGLEMLLYFKKFCDENGLLFYLCGGCCIGAIRNKGFIPWDDDVDIFMPRADYEKLEKLWQEKADTEKYSYCKPSEKDHYRNLFATINDNNTTFIKLLQKDLDINHGLTIDILPLDGYPKFKIQRIIQMFWSLIYSLFCAQVVPINHGKAIALGGKFLLTLVSSRSIRYKIWRIAEKKMTKYRIEDCDSITELCSGFRYMKKRYPKDAFSEATYKEFEGYQMPLPKGYDEYLKIAFGDYMKLPAKEKQVMHHEILFCDLNNGYKKYKGKKYLIK